MNRVHITFVALVAIQAVASAAPPTVADQNPAPRIASAVRDENEKIDIYTTRTAARLCSTTRVRDPFGVRINNEILSATPAVAAPSKHSASQAPSLAEALSRLKITGVNPSLHQIIIDRCVLGQSDSITVQFRGLTFEATVENITQDVVLFRDAKDGSLATVKLDIAPNHPEIAK